MEKYINEFSKECWKGVDEASPFSKEPFHQVAMSWADNDKQWAFHSNLGSITVLDRMTGYGFNVRDTETGFRDIKGEFWLASGGVDVRYSGCETVGEAIDWIKGRANTCRGN